MNREGYFWTAAGAAYSACIAVAAVRYGRHCTGRMDKEMGERRKADEATQKAKESAEAANRAKSDFLANMSHDIRTPMNAIIGLSENLIGEEMSPECHRNVRIIHDEGQHLLRLINDILDLSKVEAGEFTYEKAPFNLRNLVEGVVSALSVRAHERGLTLKHEIMADVPERFIGDAECVRRILVNLAGNAVKFTDKGGVTVRVANTSVDSSFGRVSFTVQDTGIGIPPEKLGQIFERFKTSDAGSLATGCRGAGLGLTIARKIAEGMGGTVRAESEVGRGSTFVFTLTLEVAVETPESAVERLRDRRIGSDFGKKSRPLHILMAEDNENNRLVVQAFMKNSDIKIDVALNGEEALKMFQASAYDLVLMDIQMPVMDGLTATHQIRKWEESQGRAAVPIVALTAHALKEEREKSLMAGCDAHMTKPINKRTLMRTVYQFTRKNMAPRERVHVPDEISSLAETLRIRKVLRTIMPRFLEINRKSCLTMRAALAAGNYKTVEAHAHQIKGSGGSCGYPRISEIGHEIELAIHAGDDAGVNHALDQLSSSLDEIQTKNSL